MVCPKLQWQLYINEFLKPIITDDEIEKYDIDVRKIFDDLHVVYCG